MHKITRLSVINEYEKGGLKMIDLETMITSLRLTWLKRIFGVNDGAWKDYLCHQLKRLGGLFVFHCNYIVKMILFHRSSILRCSNHGGLIFEMSFPQKNIGIV